MIRRLILRKLDVQEAILGESMDYLRHMVRTSLRAFLRFTKILSFASYRRKLPTDAAHVARMVAARSQDCGPCVQISVNLASAEGMNPEWIQAILDGRPDDLPKELAEVYLFTDHVVRMTGDEGDLRIAIRNRWSEEAVIELALAIAGSQVFPIVKRVMGYAKSCSVVKPRLPEGSAGAD
ncbi:MAG: hypothetical protein MPJ50_03195 [Pirellulales bacterium]|nr:hypothetical protein [Pirellulales bacterium]